MMRTVAIGPGAGPSSTRPSSQPSDLHSGLRAVTECTGSAVVVHVGGDIDASNEVAWQRLVRSRRVRSSSTFGTSTSWDHVHTLCWPRSRCGVAGAG